jgi:predicted phosphodiesterase
LKFKSSGRFKIVQFTDLHFKHASSKNKQVLQSMANVLGAERPDVVILTGDLLSKDPAEGVKQIVAPMVGLKIPWAATLGNHDHEHGLNRAQVIALLAGQPGSLVDAGPTDVSGEGNYILKVKDSGGSRVAAVIYCIDSLAYAPGSTKKKKKYAWIEPDQIEWYRKHSAAVTKANGGKPLPSLAFFHIPLPEYNDAWESRSPRPIGTKGEKVCCPEKNTGLLHAMVKCRDVMGVFTGHDHDNDYAGVVKGICLAYAGRSGLDTYGKLPLGGRVVELIQGKRQFDTWIRHGDGKVLHKAAYPASFR